MKKDPFSAQIELLTVFFEGQVKDRLKIGRLARKDRNIFFEYDSGFLQSGLEISPFRLPLRPGVTQGDPAVFQGLMGVFEDSLPDGWGRLLIDRQLRRAGRSPGSLTPLDRLAWVGSRSMGALTYEPEKGIEDPLLVDLREAEAEAAAVLKNVSDVDLEHLIALGGSPQGARPKALIQIGPDHKKVIYGGHKILPGFTPYLVKFRAALDDVDGGAVEHAYALMARAAGIDMPETRLLGVDRMHPGYFAASRFDRTEDGHKVHMHSLSGLLHAPHSYPSVTYRDLLLVTRALTRDEACVTEAFRRACFNVFARNRDDHAKNFAFLMSEKGKWRLSPAFDLTYSEGMGGEHMMLVDTEGKDPGRKSLEALAKDVGIKRFRPVIDEVREAVARFDSFAKNAQVPRKTVLRIAKVLKIVTY